MDGNRDLHSQRLRVEQSELEHTARLHEIYAPRLTAAYQYRPDDDEDDTGDARVGAELRTGGFVVEPFAALDYDQAEAGSSDELWTSSVGVAVSRQLLRWRDDLRLRLPLDRANADAHRAAIDLEREVRDLAVAVVESFYAVQAAQSRLRIRQARVRDAEDFLARLEPLVPRVKAPVEAVNARIDLNRARADLLREEAAVASAREALAELLGRPVAQPPEIREEDVATWPAPVLTLEPDLTATLTGHERIRRLAVDRQIQAQELRVAQEQALPEVEGSLTVQQRREGDSPYSGEELDEGQVLLGVSMNLPLDGWAAERARARQVALRGRALELEQADVEADLERQVRQQHRRVAELELQVELAQERQRAEQDKLDSTLTRYANGEIDNLEVTRAKETVESAALTLLEARIDRIIAVARYRALVP